MHRRKEYDSHKVLLVHLGGDITSMLDQPDDSPCARKSACTHHTFERISSPVQIENEIINGTVVSASES